MTVQELRDMNEALLDKAEELTAEYSDVPAGSVLRCFARAAHQAREWGCPPEHVATTAATTARWLLAQRQGRVPAADPAAVSRPRLTLA